MPPRTRIPTEADFVPLAPDLTVSLVYPSPRESTTALLVLFHGLGDSEAPFASFARNLNLPGVLAIAVRGTSPLPPALVGSGGPGGEADMEMEMDGQGPRHFHWGDDLTLAATMTGGGGALDPDPGFDRAAGLVLNRLVRDVLRDACGWHPADILLFGFGQGGAFALGLAARLGRGERVEELSAEDDSGAGARGEASAKAFKGVVSIGGALPPSMVPSSSLASARGKARTPVLVCGGAESEAVDEEAVDFLRRAFADVRVVRWRRDDDGMPRNREEALPMMRFFAERLRGPW